MRLDNFYNSKEWEKFTRQLRLERTTDDGLICEYCKKPIVRKYDAIAHHITFLTEENVNDFNVSLNPDNIQFVHHGCHNKIHNRRGWKRKEVYLVYGAPLSGKTSWVNENKEHGDLVVDIDNIWQCVTGSKRYDKPEGLKSVVFAIRDNLYESVKYRRGRWQNAYIIGGFPLCSERERLCKEMGAREVYIDTDRDECMRRLEADTERDTDEWSKYIERWFQTYR